MGMATVRMANFLGMPRKRLTVAMWVKGTKGTMFSYASKHKVRAFVLENPQSLIVHVRNVRIQTKLQIGNKGVWQHLAVTWNSPTGMLLVYLNGKPAFKKIVAKIKGQKITTGGCVLLGQQAAQACKSRIASKAYEGSLADVMVWKKAMAEMEILTRMTKPISDKNMAAVNNKEGSRPNKNLRIAYLSKQWSHAQIDLLHAKEKKTKAKEKKQKAHFEKKAKKAERAAKKAKAAKAAMKRAMARGARGGTMSFGGSGDVHYSNFAGCKYDDQSVGEWVVAQVRKEFFHMYPLKVQYRTSPQKTRCSWCQDGAVSYIDGCAVQFKTDQASAGFGGFNVGGYTGYAAMNGKKLHNRRWNNGAHIKAMHTSLVDAVMATTGVTSGQNSRMDLW